ncbi:MAG: hypothetical protein KDA80_16850 [Planctomycetaceae bacterium]|nr:hypothetical protein [Planctomycetaceae bacterium]
MADAPQVLLLCKDLFFTSQLHGAIKQAELVGRTCLSMEQCQKQIREHRDSVVAVIADLEQDGFDVAALKGEMAESARLIVFGPHVREDLFVRAKDGGADVLLTRGQAASSMGQLLADL